MKRLVLLLLAVCLMISGCGQSKREDSAEENVYEKYVIAIPGYGDMIDTEVVDKINRILEQSLGVDVEIIAFPISKYPMETRQALAGTQQIDIMICLRTYVEDWLQGNLLPLDDYLDEYGPDIADAVGALTIDNCRLNGLIYGIPNVRDYAITTDSYYLNKRILEENGYSAKDIDSVEMLDKIFEEIHKKDDSLIIVSTNLTAVTENKQNLNAQVQFFGILDEKTDHYMNYLESEEYRNILYEIRDWQQKGYIGFSLENGKINRRKGTVLAEARCGKPGAAEEVSSQRGEEYVEVTFGHPVIIKDVYNFNMYAVTANTISPEGSVKLLNEMYTNPELNKLFSNILGSYLVPNMFMTDIPVRCPENIWEQTKEFNQNAEKAVDLGFIFDPSSVMKEYLDVRKIYEVYKPVLENGLVDIDEALDRMLAELDTAGIDKVIEEENRQYKEWKAQNSYNLTTEK